MDQARILAHSLHRIIESLVDHEIPIHFIKFPRYAEDIKYLYRRLKPVLPKKLSFAEFSARASSIIESNKIRTGHELSVAQPQNIPAEHRPVSDDAAELPSFETLDQIALKRQLRSTVSTLERTKAERTELLAKQTDLAAERDALDAERTELLRKQTDLAAARDALDAERTELLTKQTGLVAARDALEAERNELLAKQTAVLAERDALEAERTQLLTKQADLVARGDALEAERNELLTNQTGLLAQRDALAAERAKLESRLTDLLAEHELALANVNRLINSASWKLTQPMRTIADFVRTRR